MLARALMLALAAAATTDVAAADFGFVYVRANVGGASGGHAALVDGETVYHLQTDGDGTYRLARDTWVHFAYVYAGLQNRPLSVAHVAVTPETRDRVLDRFARAYVEQDIAISRREAQADDVAWLEAWTDGRSLPPLRNAGLFDPTRPADPDAVQLRDALRGSLSEAQRAFVASTAEPTDGDVEALRERLALREALLALDQGWALAAEALVSIPERFDDPLTAPERASLERFALELERSVGDLLHSARPDRGYALLLAQARYTAVRRSLKTNRLVLLDAWAGHVGAESALDEAPSELTRARQLEYAGALVRRGREVVLASGRLDESTYNLLEEAAALLERTETGYADVELLDVERRKLPARARSVSSPAFTGNAREALDVARARLADTDARYRARWTYDLLRRNCITELARTADEALAGRVPADETLGFIPFVFFDRVRERLPVERVEQIPSHRALELARIEREAPGLLVRLRESTTLGSTVYTPRRRDGAFLFFTDDVFWRRPLYGLTNLTWAAGYTAFGVGTAPFDRGARVKAGLSGMFWSLPELAFENVRKGSFAWVDDVGQR